MALSYAELKSGSSSSGSKKKSGGNLSYQDLKKSTAPLMEKTKTFLSERDQKYNKTQLVNENIKKANEEAKKYAEAANKANKTVSILEAPGEFLKEFGKSLARPAISMYQGITKPVYDAKGTYNVPGLGQVESYQNEVERLVGDVKSSGGTAMDAAKKTAGVAIQAPIDVLSTVYAPAKGFQVLRGGKIIRDTVGMGLKVGAPIGGAQGLADSLKEGKGLGETTKEVVKGAAVGTALVAGLGAGGILVKKGASKIADGIAKFFQKDKTVADTILDRKKEIAEDPQDFIEKAGQPKDPVTFLASRNDLDVQRVPAIKNEDGSTIATSFTWNNETGKGKLLISPAATPESVAQEIGNYLMKSEQKILDDTRVRKEVEKILGSKKVFRGQAKGGGEGEYSFFSDSEVRANDYAKAKESETGASEVTSRDIARLNIKEVKASEYLDFLENPKNKDLYDGVTFLEPNGERAYAIYKGRGEGDSNAADAIREILMSPDKAKDAPVLVKYLEDIGVDVPGVIGRSSSQIRAESALLKRANEVLPDEFKMDTSRSKITIKDELKRAAELYQENPDRALKVALGKVKADGEFQNAMYVYLKEVATKNKDWATVAKLAKSAQLRSTRYGQENAILSSDVASPQAKYLKKLFEMKLTLGQVPSDLRGSLERAMKSKKGRDISNEEVVREALSTQTKELRKTVDKKKVDLKAAQDLIDKLTCA